MEILQNQSRLIDISDIQKSKFVVVSILIGLQNEALLIKNN